MLSAPRVDPGRADGELPTIDIRLVADLQRVLDEAQDLPSASLHNFLRWAEEQEGEGAGRARVVRAGSTRSRSLLSQHTAAAADMGAENHDEKGPPYQKLLLEIRHAGRQEQVQRSCGPAGKRRAE